MYPPQVTVSVVNYPSTASVQPKTFGTWVPVTNNTQGGLLITGFRGKLRVYAKLTYFSTGTKIPVVLKWIGTNSQIGSSPDI